MSFGAFVSGIVNKGEAKWLRKTQLQRAQSKQPAIMHMTDRVEIGFGSQNKNKTEVPRPDGLRVGWNQQKNEKEKQRSYWVERRLEL